MLDYVHILPDCCRFERNSRKAEDYFHASGVSEYAEALGEAPVRLQPRFVSS